MALTRRRVRGRTEQAPFLALPLHMLSSPQWDGLSAQAIKLLIVLAAQYRGTNNGDFCAAWTVLAKRGWRSRDTKDRALRELLEGGWIVLTRQGGRHRASLYAITWRGIDECGGKVESERPNPVPLNLWKTKSETVTRLPKRLTCPPCRSEPLEAATPTR